jgi:hypothetical protein
MFLTRAVFDSYVAVPDSDRAPAHQDEAGRLWDVVWMTRFAILLVKPGCDRLPVALYVRNDYRALSRRSGAKVGAGSSSWSPFSARSILPIRNPPSP